MCQSVVGHFTPGWTGFQPISSEGADWPKGSCQNLTGARKSSAAILKPVVRYNRPTSSKAADSETILATVIGSGKFPERFGPVLSDPVDVK